MGTDSRHVPTFVYKHAFGTYIFCKHFHVLVRDFFHDPQDVNNIMKWKLTDSLFSLLRINMDLERISFVKMYPPP